MEDEQTGTASPVSSIEDCPEPMDTDESSEDSDYDTDLEADDETILTNSDHRRDYKDLYVNACDELGIPQSRKFLRQFMSTTIDLKHYGLMDKGMHAIAIALVRNYTVTTLNLEDNGFTEKGALYLAKMLTENCFITSLDLSVNRIGAVGIQALSEMLQSNVTLQELNISGNKLKGKEVVPIIENLKENFYLKSLNLSNNQIEDMVGDFAGPAIAINNSLEVFNLGWNSIGDKGALKIFRGLRVNCMLRDFVLSHNGVTDLAMRLVAEVLEQNENLKTLDLSCNFIHHSGLAMIGKSLRHNTTLETLRVGRNPLQSLAAKTLLQEILANPQSALEELDMEGVAFNEHAEEILSEISQARPNFTCTRGVLIHGAVRVKEGNRPDTLRIFLNYVRMRGLRLTDLFKQIARDPNKTSISSDEFIFALKAMNIPLNHFQIKEVVKEMDVDDDGSIEFGEFANVKKKLYSTKRAKLKPKKPAQEY